MVNLDEIERRILLDVVADRQRTIDQMVQEIRSLVARVRELEGELTAVDEVEYELTDYGRSLIDDAWPKCSAEGCCPTDIRPGDRHGAAGDQTYICVTWWRHPIRWARAVLAIGSVS